MPVVIDQLDLVHTEPDRSGAAGETAPRPTSADVDRTLAALRSAARRDARTRAD